MKLSLSLLLATMASTASAAKTVSASNAAKVLRAARRVEQAAEGDDANANENQYDYLSKYSLKMIGCKAGTQVVDPDTQEVEYSAAIFRLCPTESGCANDKAAGCDSGYGDFVVGLNTFVQAYFEDQRDNMNWDDQFQVDRYGECAEYEMEQGDDDANPYADMQFFIGPACTEDELDVRLALFSEETCTTASDVAFGDISNGWTMPYSSGGLVSSYCSDCLAYDEDQAAYELRDMCLELYTGAAYACEQSMEYFSYYGQNVQGCDYVEENLPASIKKSSKGGKVFGWILFSILVIGMAAYVVWWRKKKQSSSSAGLVA